MRPPTLPWVVYTLFRLICVVFMIWTLVVQFIALSDDLKEYTRTKDHGRPIVSSGMQSSLVSMTATSAKTSEPSIISIGSAEAVADETTDVDVGPIAIGVIGYEDHQRGTKRRIGIVTARDNSAGEADTLDEAYYGGSGIPDQPGGAFFATVLRLCMAILLLLLISAQLGFPEDFMYRYGGLLGPQSTPLTLGVLQTMVALQDLSMHANNVLLIPPFTLLGLGLLNVFIGSGLLYMARRLPAVPPPPLYFSKAYRLLYWTRPPIFYNQLNLKHPAHPAHQSQGEGTEVSSSKESQDVEKQQIPRSNALEIGLAESDDEVDDWVVLNTAQNAMRTRPSIRYSNHTDVRKGGYPTFSGHGVNAPGRNVPAGELEVSGDKVAFVSEDGRKVHDLRELRADVGGLLEPAGSQKSRSTKAQQQRSKLAPLHMPNQRVTQTAPLRLPPKRTATRDSMTQPSSREPASSRTTRISKRSEAGPSLTPIGEEPSSALTSKSELRRSTQAAAVDLGPHFPLPPSRSQSADSASRSDLQPEDDKVQTRKARRESSAGNLSQSGRWAALARDPASPPVHPLPISPLRLMTTSARSSKADTDTSKMPPKSPRLAQIKAEEAQDPSPCSQTIPRSPRDPNPSGPVNQSAKRATTLRPSLAPDSRSPNATDAHTERVSQGVRFQLDSPVASTPSTGTLTASTITPGLPSPKSGLRIPGTNFTLPLPFAVPGTPRPDPRVSIDSTDSKVSAARPESTASSTSFASQDMNRPGMVARESSGDIDPVGAIGRRESDERAGLPRRGENTAAHRDRALRPNSFAVLGGSYLDGGSEDQKERRRISSIDLFK